MGTGMGCMGIGMGLIGMGLMGCMGLMGMGCMGLMGMGRMGIGTGMPGGTPKFGLGSAAGCKSAAASSSHG